MSFFRTRRGIAIVCAVVLLAMFLVRPGASRLKARIANSIGSALQRHVDIGSVHIRLLPRPGFDLENFVVHDDPAFGAEPLPVMCRDVSDWMREAPPSAAAASSMTCRSGGADEQPAMIAAMKTSARVRIMDGDCKP